MTVTNMYQSKDHEELLNAIDLLRSQGLNNYVRLPQLIVCGDQSSGKSSCLEAISGVTFPTKDNLCTRFATELVLRRDETPIVNVTIIPGDGRSDEEKEKLLNFKPPNVELNDLESIIDAAKEAMGLNSGSTAFSDDILRFEISGPQQPHLTLVDLPGMIHSENKQQTAKDVQLVSSLIRKYMANTRSIILAVVSAKNDYANQIVTKLARDVDPKGLRTLGIITKPDTLHKGSESETAFLELARNKDVVFRLGWHVLKNRDYDMRECSDQERDEKEQAFFSHGSWLTLPSRCLGIGALKPRLSSVLKDQIVSELPNLICDVEVGIEEAKRVLTRLGKSRGTLKEQQLHLVQVSQSFSSLVEAAVNGNYKSDFFGEKTLSDGLSRRLRAVVQDKLMIFAKELARDGHAFDIVDQIIPFSSPVANGFVGSTTKPVVPANPVAINNSTTPPVVNKPLTEVKETSFELETRKSRKIMRSKFLDIICQQMKQSRGCQLPGTFDPSIVGELFFQQAKPWKNLIDRCSEEILEAVKSTLETVLFYVTDEQTGQGVMRDIVQSAMESYSKKLEDKIAEILRPHQMGHPITYNHYFTETIQKIRNERAAKEQAPRLNAFFNRPASIETGIVAPPATFDGGRLLTALNNRTEADMDRYASSEALDCMMAYYKVSAIVGSFFLFPHNHTDRFPGRQKAIRRQFCNLGSRSLCNERIASHIHP